MTHERRAGRWRGVRRSVAALVLAVCALVPVSLALTPSEASASPLPAPCQRPGPIGETLPQVEGTVDPIGASAGDDLSGFWTGVNGIYATANAAACLVGVGL